MRVNISAIGPLMMTFRFFFVGGVYGFDCSFFLGCKKEHIILH